MRNKKLISMLMLSAGFVACTQDEIVENNFAGIENQKDLVEDVILNVSLGEDALTRAGYQGAYDEKDKDGNLTKYSVFRHFYLEPAWNNETTEDGNDDGVIGWDLTNNGELKGDMLGFCLTNDAAAITNYPFYIAGYHSADKVTDDGKGNVVTTPGKVYALAEQTNKFYYLNVDANQAVEKATLANLNMTAASQLLNGAALDADVLDVRKGILRTTSGIMTGKYIAYFPYNEKWVNPSGIPAKGELPMQDLFEVSSLSDDPAASLSTVHEINGNAGEVKYSFYDYMFAVSQNNILVDGGNRSGDVTLQPLTSALTFKLTNSALYVDEENTGESQEIKRVTIRAKEAGAAAFILNGSVDVTSLSSIKAGAKAGDVTDLIGVSFNKVQIGAATADDPATEDVNEASQATKYVTIPFFANPAVTEYVIEVYNTSGQIAAIEKTISFKPGVAYNTEIDLAGVTFENAVRKIFDEADFLEEVLAGGTLQLMRNINIPEQTATFTVENDLTIIGGKNLALAQGTFKKGITMKEGKLSLDGEVSVEGKIDADNVVLAKTDKVTGDIEANDLTINGAMAYELKQHLTVKNELNVNTSNANVIFSHVDALNMINMGTVTVVSEDVYNDDKTAVVGTNQVKVTGTLENVGTLNVSDLTVGTLNNVGNVEVVQDGTLTATSIRNTGMYKYEGEVETFAPAVFTVNGGSTSAASFNNESSTSELIWATSEDMNMAVVNAGVMTMNTACNFTGSVTNTGNMTISAKLIGATEGSAINSTAGKIEIVTDGYLELSKTQLNISGGVVDVMGGVNGSTNVKVTGDGELLANVENQQQLAAALSSTAINAKFTGIKVNESMAWPNDQTGTDKDIYLYADLTTGNKDLVLTGDLVVADASKLEAKDKIGITLEKIYVNAAFILDGSKFKSVKVNKSVYVESKFELSGASPVTVTENVEIGEQGNLNIESTGIVTVNGTIKNEGVYSHSSQSTVYGKYEGEGTWNAYPNF